MRKATALLLALALDMNELNGVEKYAYTGASFGGEPAVPATIATGDVMAYSGDCLVLFYAGHANPGYPYVPLARIDDPDGLAEAAGAGVFINAGCRFQDQGGICIGDRALIGHNCVIATLNHDMDPARRANLIPAPVHIGADAWLGANVTVLPGVTIGEGAVVAAGAVVTKDVPDNCVVAGVPARVVRELEE